MRYVSSVLLIVVLFCFAVASHAGFVVTDQQRQWAKDAVGREKTVAKAVAPNTVAVLYFKNDTRRPDLDPFQKGMTIMLITDLSQIDDLQVVERERLQALLEELDLGKTGIVEKGTAPRTGRLLGAGFLVGGDFTDANDRNIIVGADILNVIKETLVSRPSANGKIEALLDMEKTLLFDIVKGLNMDLTPNQIKVLETPLSSSHLALVHLFEAVNKSDHRDYAAAERLYKKALKADPKLVPAKEALEQLAALGLLTRKPDAKNMLRKIRSNVSLSDQLTTEYPLKKTKSPTEVTQTSQGQESSESSSESTPSPPPSPAP